MENANPNPLSKHFRTPGIYIKLPSGGRYWPENALNLPLNGELPIYPMTTKDEIILRTPDALLNGSGVVSLIQSCCPNIIDAWQTPNTDIDAILIAIRIATYGHNISFQSNCPKCKESNNHDVDLRPILETFHLPNFDSPLEIDGLFVKIKPQSYFLANKSNQISFEENQTIRAMHDANLTEETKSKMMEVHIAKLVDFGAIVDSCESNEPIESLAVSSCLNFSAAALNLDNQSSSGSSVVATGRLGATVDLLGCVFA